MGYSLKLLSAQVAATVEGVAVLLQHKDVEGGPVKWSLSGEVLPETVEAFMEGWGPAQGLEKIYGVPSRGYAGGYVKV